MVLARSNAAALSKKGSNYIVEYKTGSVTTSNPQRANQLFAKLSGK